MKKFKVVALSLGGLNNKVFNSGDVVGEDNFVAGSTPELVKQGFLKAHKLTAKEEKAEKAAEAAAQKAAEEEAQLTKEIEAEAKAKAEAKAEAEAEKLAKAKAAAKEEADKK